LVAPPVSGDIISTTGIPVNGEVSGTVAETQADESGLTEIYIEADDESYGTLIVFNGDPAMGANDLEQFGGVLESGMSCGGGGQVVLQAMNGNVISATSAPVVPGQLCCVIAQNRCFYIRPSKCAGKGGTLDDPTDGNPWTSMGDCTTNCK